MSGRLKTLAAFATLYLVWGSTYLAIRVLVRTVPGLWAAGLRFAAAAALMGCWALLRVHRGTERPTFAQVVGACAVGLLVVAASLGLLTLSEEHVASGPAALLIASVPLLVAVLRLLHGDRPTGLTVIGVLAGFTGLALLLLGGGGGVLVWMFMLLVAAGCEAAGSFYSTRWPVPADTVVGSAVQMAAGAVALCAAAGLSGEPLPTAQSNWPVAALAALAYLVLAGSVLGYSAFVWLLAREPVSRVATYAYVNPVVAVMLGAALLGERLTARAVIGSVLVVGAVFAVVHGEHEPPAP